MAFGDSATTGMADGEILVALDAPPLASRRPSTSPSCGASCRGGFPQLTFFFQPADIVSQILNFGLPAPIDIQIAGLDRKENYAMATEDRRADPRDSAASRTSTCTRW